MACSLLHYLKKGVIKQEEEILAGLGQKVGGHVVLQLPGMQVYRVLGCLCQACHHTLAQHKLAVDVGMYCSIGCFASPSQCILGDLLKSISYRNIACVLLRNRGDTLSLAVFSMSPNLDYASNMVSL